MRKLCGISVCLLLSVALATAGAAATTPGMSLFGDLKYGPDFRHFDYVNPDAPKGGTVRYSATGTFDTLNPFVIKGVPAAGIGEIFSGPAIGQLFDLPGLPPSGDPRS